MTTVSRQEAGIAIRQTVGYFGIFIGLGLTAAALGPTLTGLAENTASDLGQISFLFTARSFGYLLGSLQLGRAFDRLPGHTLLAFLLAAMGVLLGLVPASSQLWLLVAILFLLGIAEGGVDVGGNTLLVWVHRQRVGPYMNALHFFFGFGAFLAPVIVAQAILFSGGIAWAYWLLALYMLPVVIWVGITPSPKPTPPQKTTHAMGANPLLVALIVLFFILYVGVEVSYSGWIFTYTTSLGMASAVVAAYLTSVFWGSFTIGRLVGIPLSARLAPRLILTIDFFGCLASLVVILLFQESLAALVVGSAGLGFSAASMFPTMLVYAEGQFPLTGKINSWFFVGGGAGAMIFPWLTGQLINRLGAQIAIWLFLVNLMAVGGALFLVFWFSSKLKSSSPE